nr:OmpA family protein [Burkholderia sp. Ac-20345]
MIQAGSGIITDALLDVLSQRIGLSADILRHVTTYAGPVLLAALVASVASTEDAERIFSIVRSEDADVHVGTRLPACVTSTAGLKDVESAADRLVSRVTARRLADYGDHVGLVSGVPPQAAHVLVGLSGAVLYGSLKRCLLLEQCGLRDFLLVLRSQVPLLQKHMTDAIAQLTASTLATEFPGVVNGRLEAITRRLAGQSRGQDRDSGGRVLEPYGARGKRLRPRRIWVAVAGVAVILAAGAAAWHFGYFNLPIHLADVRHGAAGTVSTIPLSQPVAQQRVGDHNQQSASAASAAQAVSVDQRKEMPLEPPKSARLEFKVDSSGAPIVEAVLNSDSEKQTLGDALDRQFGSGRFTSNLVVDPTVAPAAWLGRIDTWLRLMQSPRVEGVVQNARVQLWTPMAPAASKSVTSLETVLGSEYRIEIFDPVHLMAQSSEALAQALSRLEPFGTNCDPLAVSKALNAQVIDFARSSGHVPSAAKANLEESANLLAACHAAKHPISLEVAAHSDNSGDGQANLALSEKRAQAVRAYLIAAGVPSQTLTAKGYGDAKPVESDLTAMGRFANRRIEFVPVQDREGAPQ